MQQDRAFGFLEIRSVDDAQRTFEGIANSVSKDLHETVIEPAGARYQLPIPLFFHVNGGHSQAKPIGDVFETWVADGKRWVRARVPAIADDGTDGGRSVKSRVDGAWADIKNKLVRGLSIDFVPIKQKGPRISEWRWLGLSVVPIPSNQDATITHVRSAFGAPPSPGVSGTPTTKPRHGKMTIQEQITQHENTRAAKVARKQALIDAAAERGETMNEAEAEEFDTLDLEVRSIDQHLVRLESSKKDLEKRATPVDATTGKKATESRNGVPVKKESTAEKGIAFARYAMALIACRGSRADAQQYVKQTFPEGDISDAVVAGLQTRAAVAPGTVANATFAAPLVVTQYLNDFLELLRPATLIGRIPNMRHVPFNVSMPAQTAGGTYKWVGEGKMKSVTNAQYAAVTLTRAKVAGIIVLTEELVRQSTPSAEAAVRDELVKGATAFLDAQFVDSTVAAVAGVNPASITNGVTGTAASGATMANARTDIAARIAAFAALGYPLGELVILMSESQAFNLGLGLNAVGQPLFPGITVTGGTLLGVPVVTSQAVGNQIVIAHAPSIMMADEGGIEIDVSREASIQLDSAPTDPPDATVVLTSLWQANLVGLRVERFITWGKARSNSVDRITSVAYAP